MERQSASMLRILLVVGVLVAGCRDTIVEPHALRSTAPAFLQGSTVSGMYAPDFVSTAASGYDLNDTGDVVGTSYRDTGCGPFCLPPQDNVVWRSGSRIVLPVIPGFGGYQFPTFINQQGLVAGFVGYPGGTTHAALWTWNGTAYTAQDLGVLPGMSSADVAGLDDQGRMVGWSSIGGAIPSATAPFMWSQATGMVNLASLGYPNERPSAMSPGGKVVTWGSRYQLGNPASAVRLPPTPQGFVGAGSNGSAINDAGDQAHFLVSTSSQNLVYPFRLSNGGAWQLLSSFGTGRLSSSGMGSINAAQDISLTVGSTGMIAAGPAGVAQNLGSLLSPAYPGTTVGVGGPMNASGQILTKVMIGRSQRLMKLTPVSACAANCLVVSSLAMTGKFVQDPAFPGSCFQGGKMYNLSTATVTVTSETGAALASVQVRGHFLDDYWTDSIATGATNASGVVTFTHKGLCGVGAIAFLVDRATLGTRTLDRTRGTLTNFVIPTATTPPPTPNQPPVANWTYACTTAHVCTFDGTLSTDPDGSIAAYSWKNSRGKVLATTPTFTKTFVTATNYTLTLTVTDNGGLSNSKTQVVVVR